MELKSNFSGKSSLEIHKSRTEKFLNEIKLICFQVTQLLLKNEESSLVLSNLAIIVQFFQVTYILFNRQIWPVWMTYEVSRQIHRILGYSLLVPYFEMVSFVGLISIMYTCLGLVLFGYMLVVLLNYRLQTNFSWITEILRGLIKLFLSILYMPMMDLFFSILACTINEKGESVHLLFSETKCWQGTHIVHGIVSIFGIIIFYLFCITFALIYYEPRYIPQNPSSKKNGRFLVIFLTYELIMIICYTFMVGKQDDYIFIFILAIGSFLVFWIMHVENPHNNKHIAKAWSVLAAVNMWGVIILCFAKFLEGQLFFGTIYAWLFGLPFMIAAVLKADKLNYELLLTNLNKVSDPQDVLNLTDYLIKLYKAEDSDSQLMIDGFLEIHRATCAKEDCYLKQKRSNNQRILKSFFKDLTLSERDVDILMVLGQVYFNQIKRFPNNINLRIRYSLFLFDLMKQRQQALNELLQAELQYPSFDYEFIIYRYKQIIEIEMNMAQSENTNEKLDVVTEIAFQNNMRQFQNKIERATLMHMDFWSQLQEESPDLGKMNEIGSKINLVILQVEDLWNRMQKMTQNLPKAMRLYAKFIIEVLQDKEFGEQLLDKSKKLQQQIIKQRNQSMLSILNNDDLCYESNATIIVSTAPEKFAQIINLNLSCCNLFGFVKSEMINRKINIFMPSIYSKFHDAYFDRFMQTNDNRLINRERLVFIKQKSNYILPCFLTLKLIQSLDDSLQLGAQFRPLKQFKPTCHLIVGANEVIDSLSASCISFLNIDYKSISNGRLMLTDIFPNFDQSKELYLTKSGGPLIYKYREQQLNNKNSKDENVDCEIQFICYMNELVNNTNGELIGYVVRLEINGNEKSMMQDLNVHHHYQGGLSLQFKFNPRANSYCGEFLAELNSQRVDQTIIWDQGDLSSMISSNQPEIHNNNVDQKNLMRVDNIDQKKGQIDYGEGIVIVRLFENKIQEINDPEVISDEENEDRVSVFQRNQNEDFKGQGQEEVNEKNNIFRSRKQLSQIINNYQIPKVITKVNWTANILTIILVVLSFTDFFIIYEQYDDIYNTIVLVRDQNQRNAELQTLTTSIQNLLMLNMDVWEFQSAKEQEAYEILWKDKLNQSISNVDSLNKELMLTEVSLSDAIIDMMNSDVVSMKSSEGISEMFDLSQAIQQLLSKSLIIRDKPISNIRLDDIDVNFVLFNSLNSLVYQLRAFSTLYANELRVKSENNKDTFLLILSISAAALGVGLFIMIMAIVSVNKTVEEMLVIFIDIPDKIIKYLFNRAEGFLSNLQVGEDDELISEMDDIEKENQNELNKQLRAKRKRKKYKNSNKEQRNFTLGILIIILLAQGYFILNYQQSKSFLTDLSQMIPEINATARAESFYRFVDISERSLFLNRNQTIMNQDAYEIVKNNINGLYSLDSSIHQEHSQNVEITSQIYLDSYRQVFMEQPCTIISNFLNEITEQECQLFSDGAVYQGMAVGIARYFENLRYIMTIYDQFWGNPNVNFTYLARGFGKFRNITKDSDNVRNYILNLNNFNQTIESREMQDTYNRGAFRFLVSQMIQGISQDMENHKTQMLGFFIVFEGLIFIVYFFLWLPLVAKFTKDIWRTRSMLLMIPLSVIQNIKSIKSYIKMNIQINDVEV
ncbi:unnamed protein product [Paramecium octaurelia]|uniref:TmcB/TmcC TPR repeats domain-containing protein n=1 Tax=Paramecium octaurelia TaxID=43137 RepID=A0A8S1UDN1_PAROT|nr:unnamed protein product [Paramecium octaurelia]